MTVPGEALTVRYQGNWDKLYVENWWNPDEYLTADFVVDRAGEYEVTILCASPKEHEQPVAGGRYTFQLGDNVLEHEVTDVGRDRFIRSVKAGTVTLPEGKQRFTIKPVDDSRWKGLLFQGIRLEPVE